MDLQQLIADYGYIALLIGTFLEGETILLLAGFAAQRGMLSLPIVIGVAIVGTTLGDQLFFYVGRWKGLGFVERRPAWRARAVRLRRLMEKHRIPVVLGYRFMYGLRMITPFALGASGFSPAAFAVLNVTASVVWAVTFGFIGYYFGHAVERFIDDVKQYEMLVLVGVATIAAAVWLFRVVRGRRTTRRNASGEKP